MPQLVRLKRYDRFHGQNRMTQRDADNHNPTWNQRQEGKARDRIRKAVISLIEKELGQKASLTASTVCLQRIFRAVRSTGTRTYGIQISLSVRDKSHDRLFYLTLFNDSRGRGRSCLTYSNRYRSISATAL